MLAQFPKATEIVDRSLVNLSRVVSHPMDTIIVKPPEEMRFLLFCPRNNLAAMWAAMQEMGLIREVVGSRDQLALNITPAGWQRIDELSRTPCDSRKAFVAMWFSDETDAFYKEGIYPAVRDARYEPRLIKNVQFNNKIDDAIVAEIRQSRFVIADFTAGQCSKCGSCDHSAECKDKVKVRGGVYYEAGFAHGLGIPVICMVHRRCVEHLHFDTHHYNHIVYDNANDLKEQLYNRIAATIGLGETDAPTEELPGTEPR